MQAGDADVQALGVGMYVQRDVGDVGIDVHKSQGCAHDVHTPVNRPIYAIS